MGNLTYVKVELLFISKLIIMQVINCTMLEECSISYCVST
jgi:hypothetical protein